MDKSQRFEDFLVQRNDELDNAAFALALAMLFMNGGDPDDGRFPWNMEIIGAILDDTQAILKEHGYDVCWPYHEDEIPCTAADSCKNKICLFKCGQ